MSDAKLTAGLIVQPLVAAVVAFLAFPFLLLDGSGRTAGGSLPDDPTDAALSVALGTGFVALIVTMVAAAFWALALRPTASSRARPQP